MSFFANIYAPTLNLDLRIKELSFLQYKTLNKFITNNKDEHIVSYFDEILKENILEKETVSKLTGYDKFCALFMLRCLSVSPNIEYKKDNSNFKYPLLPFLNNCLDMKTTFTEVVNIDNIEFILGLPYKFIFNDMFDAYFGLLHAVNHGHTKIIVNDLTIEEKNELYKTLPITLTQYLKDYLLKVSKDFENLVLDFKLVQPIAIKPFDLSMLELLRALFSSNLSSLYELQYVLVSKAQYSPEYIDKNTLAENLVLQNLLEQEYDKNSKDNTTPKSIPIEKVAPLVK